MKFEIKQLYRVALWVSILGIGVFVIDFGFNQPDLVQQILE